MTRKWMNTKIFNFPKWGRTRWACRPPWRPTQATGRQLCSTSTSKTLRSNPSLSCSLRTTLSTSMLNLLTQANTSKTKSSQTRGWAWTLRWTLSLRTTKRVASESLKTRWLNKKWTQRTTKSSHGASTTSISWVSWVWRIIRQLTHRTKFWTQGKSKISQSKFSRLLVRSLTL